MEKLYRLLYPMRIVLITSRRGQEDNIMAAAWCFPLSRDPPLFGVSLTGSRHSYPMIKEGGCFGINLVAPEMKEAALLCGTRSGRDVDKFAESGLAKEEGEKIDCALVGESPVSIECRLADVVKTGDHYLVVGEAVNVTKRREAKGLYQKEGRDWVEV
ncbi:flavin reductase family protein [Candidatus Micrarchaeota archaeon]|nr:flavin reductase family protein [Candidatus Micrarchaeota archaeon]MBD3417802.1 flavin reductase family protein [Candidatus Micrarchaeota archaeon]